MGRLFVVTGPPGAGKSTVTRVLARRSDKSVVVTGDVFFGFLASGTTPAWLPEATEQNEVVTAAAAASAGAFARGGYTTFYDGVVGPSHLAAFTDAAGVTELDYLVLLPSVETCVRRVATRQDHGFSNETATRRMHAEFATAVIDDQLIIHDPPADAATLATLIETALAAGTYQLS